MYALTFDHQLSTLNHHKTHCIFNTRGTKNTNVSGIIKILFYTILPLGFASYLPVQIMTNFNIYNLLVVIFIVLLFIGLAFLTFYKGLRKYSSTNLMNARV